MSAVLEFIEQQPKEVWLVARNESVRKRVLLTEDEEEKIVNSNRYEIVDGEIRERAMPNPEHSRIQAELAAELRNYVKSNKLGVIYTECHFELKKNLVRVPDVAFVAFESFPESGESTDSRWLIAPDLAIEIISPTDDYEEVLKKIAEYFEAQVKQVWLISPEQKILTLYRSRKDVVIFTDEDELVCEDLLPQFRLKLKEVFQAPTHP